MPTVLRSGSYLESPPPLMKMDSTPDDFAPFEPVPFKVKVEPPVIPAQIPRPQIKPEVLPVAKKAAKTEKKSTRKMLSKQVERQEQRKVKHRLIDRKRRMREKHSIEELKDLVSLQHLRNLTKPRLLPVPFERSKIFSSKWLNWKKNSLANRCLLPVRLLPVHIHPLQLALRHQNA